MTTTTNALLAASALATALLYAPSATPAAPQRPNPQFGEGAALVLATDDTFVHLVQTFDTHLLLETDRATGDSRILLRAGSLPTAHRRIMFENACLLGVIARADRVHALTWRQRSFDRPMRSPTDRGTQQQPAAIIVETFVLGAERPLRTLNPAIPHDELTDDWIRANVRRISLDDPAGALALDDGVLRAFGREVELH